MFCPSTRYEPSASGGGVSGPCAYGIFPQRRGPGQAERHPNGDPEGGAHAASKSEPVGAESGPDSEFGHFLSLGTSCRHYHEFSRWHLSLCSSTSAWVTWNAAKGATATLQPKALPTHAVRPAARGKGVATGMACAVQAAAAATVRLPASVEGCRTNSWGLNLAMLTHFSVPPPDVCVADVDSFVSQRIPGSDGELSPQLRKKGWKRRRMTTKGPSGIAAFPSI